MQWNILADHLRRVVKLSKEDRGGMVRYLTPEEEKTLHVTLTARDDRRRAERVTANAWRRTRRYTLLPGFDTCTDHLTPITLLALDTGCRRGERFTL